MDKIIKAYLDRAAEIIGDRKKKGQVLKYK
jgi:hypothetical protein